MHCCFFPQSDVFLTLDLNIGVSATLDSVVTLGAGNYCCDL